MVDLSHVVARDLSPYEQEVESLGEHEPARLCFAATHVAVHEAYGASPHTPERPGTAGELAEAIDWAATRAIRTALDDLGFGIAEAMDTAQRFELGWQGARRLIEECGALGLRQPWVAGAGSDQREHIGSIGDLVDAVVEQVELIQARGGCAVLLPQAWLVGRDEEATVDFYRGVVEQVRGPLVVHWLGEMFAPALAGYFPGDSFRRVMDLDPDKIRGVKISLLDADRERRIRDQIAPNGQVVLTGDDWNFPELIGGSGAACEEVAFGERRIGQGDFSHALLGILGPVGCPASLALRFLAAGRRDRYHELMDPGAEVGRVVFEAPTSDYKAGVAFLSWARGEQPNRWLPNHLERNRSADHYARLVAAAAAAGALDAEGVARARSALEG